MKIKVIVFVVLCGVFFVNLSSVLAQNTPKTPKNDPAKKLIEKIVGKWQLTNTIDKNKKSGSARDTVGMSWIEFTADGKYHYGTNGTNGSVQPADSGSYRLNEQQGVLYLQSTQTDTQVSHPPVEWAVTFDQGNAMTLAGRGSTNAQRYRYVYTKTKEGLSTNKTDQ